MPSVRCCRFLHRERRDVWRNGHARDASRCRPCVRVMRSQPLADPVNPFLPCWLSPDAERKKVMNDIEVSFPGGKRVDARVGSFVVHTDQPADQGGEGGAVSPFDLFLASLATCAGIYVL